MKMPKVPALRPVGAVATVPVTLIVEAALHVAVGILPASLAWLYCENWPKVAEAELFTVPLPATVEPALAVIIAGVPLIPFTVTTGVLVPISNVLDPVAAAMLLPFTNTVPAMVTVAPAEKLIFIRLPAAALLVLN